MALYAFDGTWNKDKTDDDKGLTNTNVLRFYQSYDNNSTKPNFNLYVPGVGTRLREIGKLFGGFFGMGELPRINEAYDRLCTAWAAGDHTIDIIGFSRGAATTLDFCHTIQERGIRQPGKDDVIEPHPKIRFLGVWDVVAAFGLANLGNAALNIGHHLSVPRSNLQFCFHALALDERRPSFLPTRLGGAEEVWFRGVHSDIGGGNTNRGLNDIALKWMMSKAKAAGLPIGDVDIAALHPIPTTAPHPDHKLPLEVRPIAPVDRCHYTLSPMDGWATPPSTCPVETEADERQAAEMSAESLEVLPREARLRLDALWETAEDEAKKREFSIGTARDAMGTLFESRVVLITNDNDLQRAGGSVRQLVKRMTEEAHRNGFHMFHEVDLLEALFNLHALFPFTE
jgi:hypothetical protein